jgi:hypothetical protein
MLENGSKAYHWYVSPRHRWAIHKSKSERSSAPTAGMLPSKYFGLERRATAKQFWDIEPQ